MVKQARERQEAISPEALTRFEQRVLKGQPGDRRFGSVEALIADLHRPRPRRTSIPHPMKRS